MPTVTSNTFQTTVSTGIEPADYYVDASRPDDSGNGLTPATAKKTLQGGIGLLSSGDILEIAGGDYRGWTDRWANSIPSGSAGNYTVIRGAAGETVRFLMAVNGTRRPLEIGDSANIKSYIEFSNITCDQQNTVSAFSASMLITGETNNLRFIDCTFTNAYSSAVGVFDPSGNAQYPNRSIGQHYFEGCIFENSGYVLYQDHGIYCNHRDCTFVGNIFRNNFSMGAQIYHSSGAWRADGTVFKNNIAYGNGDSGLVFDGHDCVVKNNVFYNNAGRGLSVFSLARRAKVYNNTIYQGSDTANQNPWFGGVVIWGDTDYIDLRNNIIYPYGGYVIQNDSSGANNTISNNYSTDPSYLDAAGRDFHLQASSPSGVKTGGVTLAEVTDDFDGNSRTAPYSIGAFEENG